MVESDRPVVAVYVRHYLSPSETFIYRQLQGVCDSYRPIVLTAHPHNLDLFPTESLYARPKGGFERVYRRLANLMTGQSTWITRGQWDFWSDVMKKEHVQVIHAHFGHFAIDLLPLARAMGIPMVVTLHGVDASFLLQTASYAKELAGLVDYAYTITVSKNMADRLASRGIKPRRHSVHYIGVPVDEFRYVDRKPVRDKMAVGEPIRFLAVSNFIEVKGHRYTVEAFARYLQDNANAELILAGDGPLQADIQAMVSALGIRDKVRFTGRVKKDQVVELMEMADSFVQHSVSLPNGRQEGLPTVLMEAMSTGLPVIATRHSGIPELVHAGENGFLVEERDIDGYVSAMKGLSSADAEIGQRARQTIETTFNMSIQNERLVEIYRKTVDERV